MRPADAAAEVRALLTRGATLEAAKQSALARGDAAAAQAHELELARLWARYCDIEPQA